MLKDPDPTDKLEKEKGKDEILLINKDDIFTASKKFELKPVFFTFSNLRQGEKLIDRYKEILEKFNGRTSVINSC